jgi:hypothetical protein
MRVASIKRSPRQSCRTVRGYRRTESRELLRGTGLSLPIGNSFILRPRSLDALMPRMIGQMAEDYGISLRGIIRIFRFGQCR